MEISGLKVWKELRSLMVAGFAPLLKEFRAKGSGLFWQSKRNHFGCQNSTAPAVLM
jgi:hypothetical protein